MNLDDIYKEVSQVKPKRRCAVCDITKKLTNTIVDSEEVILCWSCMDREEYKWQSKKGLGRR